MTTLAASGCSIPPPGPGIPGRRRAVPTVCGMTIGFSSRMVGSLLRRLRAGRPGPRAEPGRPPAPASDPGAPRPTALQPPPLYRSGTQVRPRAGAPEVPQDVSALSWLVADAGTGEVLAAHDAHRKLPPASTLKTLFALTVLPALPGGHPAHRRGARNWRASATAAAWSASRRTRPTSVADLWRGCLPQLRQRRRARAGRDERRLATPRPTRCRPRPAPWAPATPMSSRPTGTTRRARCRPPTTWRSSAGPGCATRTSPEYCATATDASSRRRRLVVRDPEHQPAADRRRRDRAAIRGSSASRTATPAMRATHSIAAARRGGRTLVVTVMNPQSGGGYAVYEEARSLLDWGFGAAGRVDPVGRCCRRAPCARRAPPTPGTVMAARTEARPRLAGGGSDRGRGRTWARAPWCWRCGSGAGGSPAR